VINTLAGWAASGASLEGLTSLEGLARLAPLAPYPVAVAAVHLSTTLADIECDRAAGLRTSGVVLGRGPGLALSALLMAGAVSASAITGNSPALYASVVSLIFFVYALISERKRVSGAGILLPAKASTLAFSVSACVLFPVYLPFVAIVVILTRVYYGRRFSMRYPSL
jgi:4-hydroxybenzoate polyprenyltransferase